VAGSAARCNSLLPLLQSPCQRRAGPVVRTARRRTARWPPRSPPGVRHSGAMARRMVAHPNHRLYSPQSTAGASPSLQPEEGERLRVEDCLRWPGRESAAWSGGNRQAAA